MRKRRRQGYREEGEGKEKNDTKREEEREIVIKRGKATGREREKV